MSLSDIVLIWWIFRPDDDEIEWKRVGNEPPSKPLQRCQQNELLNSVI